MAATVIIGPCQGCGACLLTCPEHAIRPYAGTLALVPGHCTGCGECIEVCPVDAIREGPVGAGPAGEGRRPLLSVAGMRFCGWPDPCSGNGKELR